MTIAGDIWRWKHLREEDMCQSLNIAYRCIVCEKVRACSIAGVICKCEDCKTCQLLDNNAVFDLQNYYCDKCEEGDYD